MQIIYYKYNDHPNIGYLSTHCTDGLITQIQWNTKENGSYKTKNRTIIRDENKRPIKR